MRVKIDIPNTLDHLWKIDVKKSNARFYEKFPSAIEPAAMIKKAMQDPGDEVVKEQTRKENEMENFIGKINITGGIY